AQAPTIGEFFLVLLEVQDDACATFSFFDGGNVELTLAFRGPVHAFAGWHTGTAAVYIHLVGDDEGRIEAHAKLANQLGVFLGVTGEVFHEVGSAGLGDGAQVGNDILTAHADAVVFEGDGRGVPVEASTDFQLGAAFQQLGLGQRLEAQLVGGIGQIGRAHV